LTWRRINDGGNALIGPLDGQIVVAPCQLPNMRVEKREFKVSNLAENWNTRALRANPEYQRGLVWTRTQKQRPTFRTGGVGNRLICPLCVPETPDPLFPKLLTHPACGDASSGTKAP
jgi:hypothetical protein